MPINNRGVTELVHFTTNHGTLGALYTKYLKSRARLEGDHLVEHLFKPNSAFRKDVAYLDYISLSLDNINSHYYGVSSGSWHKNEDVFWTVMAFDPAIIDHAGVEFATTNNIYTSVSRGIGQAGYDALFADRITHWGARQVVRGANFAQSMPTCEQAEVLYPGEISTEYLRRIYTRSDADQSEVVGFLKGTFHDHVEVVVDPSRFERRVA